MYIQNAITCPSENKIAIIHTQYVLEERAPGPHKQIPRCSIPHANNNIRYSASCDRGSTFGGSVFWLTALLNPKSSLFQSSCVGVFFVVDLSHGIVHRAIIFIFLKISFWVRHRAPQVTLSLRKKVVHLYRCMRPIFNFFPYDRFKKNIRFTFISQHSHRPTLERRSEEREPIVRQSWF